MRFRKIRELTIQIAKVVGPVIAVGLLFWGSLLTELKIRSDLRTALPVNSTEAPTAEVAAWSQPDLFCMGTMWWISIETNVPINVVLDGVWTANVPAGSHTIYANHDDNNTQEYGPTFRWTVPTTITVTQ